MLLNIKFVDLTCGIILFPWLGYEECERQQCGIFGFFIDRTRLHCQVKDNSNLFYSSASVV